MDEGHTENTSSNSVWQEKSKIFLIIQIFSYLCGAFLSLSKCDGELGKQN